VTERPYIPRSGANLPATVRRPGGWRADMKIWWREVDRVLIGLVLLLMLIGTAAVFAASPASAHRLSTHSIKLPDLYFYWAHLRWQAVGLLFLFGASTLSRENARRAGIVLAATMLFFLLLVPIAGSEVNGAKRWISLGPAGFQPSEFLKPAFAILLGWIVSWRGREPGLPVVAIVSGVMGTVFILLMMQPDLGDAILFAGVWFVIVLLAGIPLKLIGWLAGAGGGLLTATYFLYDNARHRIDSFLGGGTAFDQVDLASRTLTAGGWGGTGLWLGVRKMNLPEAHTDYIFSVIGEEFGLIVCAAIVILYLAIIARVLTRLVDEDDQFTLLAAAGLATQIGGQAFINILVNLQLFPSKGMTLPLVSYGGSSTIAVCLTVGLLIALTRRNPFLHRETPGLRALIARELKA
jgi:cell division protein FtsW